MASHFSTIGFDLPEMEDDVRMAERVPKDATPVEAHPPLTTSRSSVRR